MLHATLADLRINTSEDGESEWDDVTAGVIASEK